MRRTCFLHVGAHKTGSTSIQTALFRDLRDPRFHYVSGGHPNGSFAIHTVFDPSPDNERGFHGQETTETFTEYRGRLARQLDREFARAARDGKHVVISSEASWQSNRAGLRNLHDHLAGLGLEIRVLAYLRPWVPWASSIFQQMIKRGRGELAIGLEHDRFIFAVRDRLEDLFAVFGRDRVEVHRFDPAAFPQRCVVRHFCGRIGLEVPPGRTWQANESLSLPAVQLHYAFNRFCIEGGSDRRPLPLGPNPLVARLRGLGGPSFRLHSSFIAGWLAERQRDDEWIAAHVGFSLSDGPVRPDDGHGVATEDDLFRFSPETRAWIARRVGQPEVRLPDGEAAARAIALQVDALHRRKLSIRERIGRLRTRITNGWIARRHAG